MKKIETRTQLQELIDSSPRHLIFVECSKTFGSSFTIVEKPFIDTYENGNEFVVDGYRSVPYNMSTNRGLWTSAIAFSLIDKNIDEPNGYNDWYVYGSSIGQADLQILVDDGYFKTLEEASERLSYCLGRYDTEKLSRTL